MPLVERFEITAPAAPDNGEKKKKAEPRVIGWVDMHTRLTGGQVKALERLFRKNLAPDKPEDASMWAFRFDAMALLIEAWNFEAPDKPGEPLPKSVAGFENAASDDLTALWDHIDKKLGPQFPNS